MIKFLWMLRALALKLFCRRFGLFSYIGKPCYLSGLSHFDFGRRVRIYPNARIEAFHSSNLIIDNNVSIGQNLHLICVKKVMIGANTTISANVYISDVNHTFSDMSTHVMSQPLDILMTSVGENSFIGYGVAILPGSTLGRGCIVGANSVVKGVFPDYCMLTGSPAKIIKRYDLSNHCWKKTDINGNFLVDFE